MASVCLDECAFMWAMARSTDCVGEVLEGMVLMARVGERNSVA